MAAKIEWSAADYAARDELAKIIDDSGLAYRVIAERMGRYISHVRVGCIHNGEKAPVRISEFLGICDVCHADPVQTLRQIIAEARRIQAEQDAREREESVEPDFLAMAAKRGDIDAEREAAYREARGTDPIDIDAWADRIKAEDKVNVK